MDKYKELRVVEDRNIGLFQYKVLKYHISGIDRANIYNAEYINTLQAGFVLPHSSEVWVRLNFVSQNLHIGWYSEGGGEENKKKKRGGVVEWGLQKRGMEKSEGVWA